MREDERVVVSYHHTCIQIVGVDHIPYINVWTTPPCPLFRVSHYFSLPSSMIFLAIIKVLSFLHYFCLLLTTNTNISHFLVCVWLNHHIHTKKRGWVPLRGNPRFRREKEKDTQPSYQSPLLHYYIHINTHLTLPFIFHLPSHLSYFKRSPLFFNSSKPFFFVTCWWWLSDSLLSFEKKTL